VRQRGRPRHDDVLTPREWEVLDLLREGLTNEQIASRLGVTHDTAKFHVSEILSKLSVATRQEAARWAGRQRVLRTLGLPVALLRKVTGASTWKLAGGAVIIAALAAMAALATGVLLSDSRSGTESSTGSWAPYTGDEGLDVLIGSMLNGTAQDLTARFGGVMAREGLLMGGPIGILEPRDVPPDDWIPRLAASERRLHAIVKDPREPFPWWDQPPQPVPRAAVFDAPRDYDIVLIVEPEEGTELAWRFSVQAGDAIDVVIENLTEPGGGQSDTPLIRRLGYLIPSPDDDPASFLVIPAADMLPPPGGLPAGSGEEPPAPVAAPTFAPGGRTGNPAIDAIIDSLLGDDAATLAQRFDLPAYQSYCDPDCETSRVPSADWAARLASGRPSLYAVYTADPADAEILIAVNSGLDAAEAWGFSVLAGEIVELGISPPRPLLTGKQRPLGEYFSHVLDAAPSIERDYVRFYVLPPRADLPQAPPSNSMGVRTGDPAVDGLLTLLQNKNVTGLEAAFDEQIQNRYCDGSPLPEDEPEFESLFGEAVVQHTAVHAIAVVPAGNLPDAEHLIVAVRERGPFWWEAFGLYEHEGQITGLILGQSCTPANLYPARDFILAPPGDGVSGIDRSRRSGLAVVDRFLDALWSRDEAAVAAMLTYRLVPCHNIGGIGAPPPCPPGVEIGTRIETITTGCHFDNTTRQDAPARLIAWLDDAALFAVTEPSVTSGDPETPVARAVLVNGPGENERTIDFAVAIAALTFSESGVIDIVPSGCGAHGAMQMTGDSNPEFLLPPP
jgi:DNA-binding CsgD family transcriptional regulator